jgi:hypothetical protein
MLFVCEVARVSFARGVGFAEALVLVEGVEGPEVGVSQRLLVLQPLLRRIALIPHSFVEQVGGRI